ncbi:MAG: thioredoxin domain-containing protein [Acidobacteria bacterium]|nr:thioredoxin domain-containing protein [Acidobacteriota bacterium]
MKLHAAICAAVFGAGVLAGSIAPAQARKKTPEVKAAPAAQPAPATAPKAAAATDDVVARVGGQPITRCEMLEAAIKQSSRGPSDEFEKLSAALDRMVDDKLLEAAAAQQNLTLEAYLEQNIESKVTQPTEDQIQKSYEENKSRAGNRTLEQIRPALVNLLQNQQRQDMYTALVADLRQKTPVEIKLDAPRAQVSVDDDPQRGNPTAPVTIIAFSDYQCPYCSRAEATVNQVRDRYGDMVKVVFRDFPLDFHQFAQKAAEAAGCAKEQNKFWEMHDKLFANQRELQPEKLEQYAGEVGLDQAAFKQCLDSGKMAAEVQADLKAGQAVGVSGTPAFFINGRMLSGAQPVEQFAKVIDEELKRAGLTPPPPKPVATTPAPAAAVPVAAPAPAPAPVAPKP